MMSFDLPAPAETIGLQYVDLTAQLMFDTPLMVPELVGFYQKALTKSGWKSTTEKANRIDFKDIVIFRNPQKDLLTLEIYDVDGKNRVLLKYQTAVELAEIERQIKAEIERRNAEPSKPSPKMAVTLPAGAQEVEQAKSRIEFKLAAGKARGAVEAWRKQFAKDGWKETVATLEEMAGAVSMAKGTYSLSLTYVDTGIFPAEITLQTTGIELEKAAEKK
jgi:hypothetical protein